MNSSNFGEMEMNMRKQIKIRNEQIRIEPELSPYIGETEINGNSSTSSFLDLESTHNNHNYGYNDIKHSGSGTRPAAAAAASSSSLTTSSPPTTTTTSPKKSKSIRKHGRPAAASTHTRTGAEELKKQQIKKIITELRDEKKLSWKEIVRVLDEDLGFGVRPATSLKRWYLEAKSDGVEWVGEDLPKLEKAIQEVDQTFEKQKWELVSKKLKEMEASKEYPARACKLQAAAII